MNEDFVSYELAVALKAAGFDEPCDSYKVAIPDTLHEVWDKEEQRYHLEEEYEYYPKITLWHAQKWLREKGIAVSVQANEIQGELWYSADIITTKGINELVDGGFDYMRYEAALSAGISAALELIKEGE